MKKTEKRLVVDIDENLKKKFKSKCAKKDLKIKDVVTKLIEHFVGRMKNGR